MERQASSNTLRSFHKIDKINHGLFLVGTGSKKQGSEGS